MDFEERRRRALALLARKGIPAQRAEPGPLRLARRLGVTLRPVYFETFGRLALFYGTGFAIVWALIRLVTVVLPGNGGWIDVIAVPIIGGIAFGPLMAGFTLRQAKKLGLPAWEALAD